jgi:hypothetical protein
MTTLYQEHIAVLTNRYEDAMVHFGLNAIVLASGEKSYYFQDDHTHPFQAYSGAQKPTFCYKQVKNQRLFGPFVTIFGTPQTLFPAGIGSTTGTFR